MNTATTGLRPPAQLPALHLQSSGTADTGRTSRRHPYSTVDVKVSSSEAGHLRPLAFDRAKHTLLQEELKVGRAGGAGLGGR